MTAIATVLALVAATAALANWWSRWADRDDIERWTKPLTLLALAGVAATIDPAEPAVRWWFLVALVLSLGGDVLLLDDRRFREGLAAFLLAHVAYTVGFAVADEWRWWSVGAALAPLAVLGATIGRRILGAARRRDPRLTVPVAAYLVVISTMAAAAAGAGNWWAVAGAILFVTSDAILGWRRFVHEASWMSPLVMVTYHLGQAGLVVSLL